MPQTPLPPGEPIRPCDSEIRWFEPVIVARHSAEQPLVVEADAAASLPQAPQPHHAGSGQEIRLVGFATDVDAPGQAGAGAPRSEMAKARVVTEEALPAGSDAGDAVAGHAGNRPEPADAGAAAGGSQAAQAAQPTSADDEAPPRRGAAIAIIAGAGLRLARQLRPSISRLLRSGIGRLLRVGAAAAAMGAIAVFAYQGGEHLAGLAGATAPAAAPSSQAAAIPAPRGGREPTRPPGDPIDPAAAYYLDRARAGDPVAKYNIAVLYARGDGVVQDFSSAAAWFREAASTGNVAAQFNLAVIYERGLGVPQNMGEAVAWYRCAAEHNYAPAQYNLGMAYAEGRGMPQDAVAGAHWYHQAAAHGLVAAMVNFAILYERGEGVERSLADAYAWYRAAARAGDTAAEERARELFQQFNGPEKGQAVMVAAAVAGTIHRPSAEPARLPPKAAGPRGPETAQRPGNATGRAGLEPRPGPLQPPG